MKAGTKLPCLMIQTGGGFNDLEHICWHSLDASVQIVYLKMLMNLNISYPSRYDHSLPIIWWVLSVGKYNRLQNINCFLKVIMNLVYSNGLHHYVNLILQSTFCGMLESMICTDV